MPGETIPVAIGQGALTVSPLQLARAYGGIAMGGKWRKPHLTKTLDQADKPVEWSFTPENWKDVIDGMYGVVNEGGGTGVRAQLAARRGLRKDRDGAARLQRFPEEHRRRTEPEHEG